MDDPRLGQLLRQAVTLLAIQKLQESLKDQTSSLRRAVIVVFSRDPQGEDEHSLWEPVTRFLGGRAEQRKKQMEQLLDTITEMCK